MASPRQKSKSRSLKRKPAQEYPDSNVDDEDPYAVDSDTLDADVPVKKTRTSKVASKKPPAKKRRKKARSEDEDSELELEEGQQIVGTVIRAPTTGRGVYSSTSTYVCKLRHLVPPGQISQNTFDFLSKLRNPDYNDREWYAYNETRVEFSQLIIVVGSNYTVRNFSISSILPFDNHFRARVSPSGEGME
jgi:hypothetical protein